MMDEEFAHNVCNMLTDVTGHNYELLKYGDGWICRKKTPIWISPDGVTLASPSGRSAILHLILENNRMGKPWFYLYSFEIFSEWSFQDVLEKYLKMLWIQSTSELKDKQLRELIRGHMPGLVDDFDAVSLACRNEENRNQLDGGAIDYDITYLTRSEMRESSNSILIEEMPEYLIRLSIGSDFYLEYIDNQKALGELMKRTMAICHTLDKCSEWFKSDARKMAYNKARTLPRQYDFILLRWPPRYIDPREDSMYLIRKLKGLINSGARIIVPRGRLVLEEGNLFIKEFEDESEITST